MTNYMIFALPQQPLAVYVEQLSSIFGITFVAHDSLYRGLYYRSGSTGEEHFLLQPNYLDHEDEWISEKYKQHSVLLYVNEAVRPGEVAAVLAEKMPFAMKLEEESL